ncbi:MFS transporter [Altererythrobacter indicus]|uniref:MFS transporter n=1 Tax=Altericroceibacterium indicum TaxID=374177 RepID=A0A845AC76_9SPHN|nr:MFS transporter [Altericroceibacterium indicum]MXP27107.1 MFS transporter [Altericroceibacterium indicum]
MRGNTAMMPKTFDIQGFVDEQKLRPIHFLVLILCFMVMFSDGFDIFMIGKIAPAIAEGFDVAPASMTIVILLQQIGLALGAFLISPLGDIYGRKRMLVISFALFGALTVATAFAPSILIMAIMRGVAGLFLASVLPMAVALVAEFTPKKSRATFIAVGMAGYSLGNVAGAVTALLVPDFGWQSGFWVGGMMPLILIPAMIAFLPESLAYRVNRDPHDAKIPLTIAKIAPEIELTGTETFIGQSHRKTGARPSPLELIRDGRARTTAILFTTCFFSMGTIALLAAWLPSFFLQMAGISIQDFALSAMVGLLGGIFGMLTIGTLLDRLHPTLPIPFFFTGYAIAIVSLSQVPFHSPFFIPTLFLMAMFQGGGQAGLNMVMARVYPPFVRSTGIGWAGGAGRIGGVILPLFGGFALTSAYSLQLTLMLVALAPIMVAILVLFLRPVETPPAPR